MTPAYDIFDSHQHVGGVFGVHAGDGAIGATPADLEPDRELRTAIMETHGVRQALLMPAHSYLKPEGLADTRRVNDRLAAYRDLDPARFPVVAGTVEPRHGVQGLAEIDRMAGELRLQGVSWHHRQQGLPMDHPVMFACLERMAALGMIPMIHCYATADFEEVWRLGRLAEAFPELPIICLDAMTDQAQFDSALAAAERAPNIILDTTSNCLGSAGVTCCVARLGAERLLFGTNLYSHHRRDLAPCIAEVLDADISDADRRLVLGGNARRLFALTEAAPS